MKRSTWGYHSISKTKGKKKKYESVRNHPMVWDNPPELGLRSLAWTLRSLVMIKGKLITHCSSSIQVQEKICLGCICWWLYNAGIDTHEIEDVKKCLRMEFEIKDLEAFWYFLNMEVARSNQGIFTSQREYTLDLLRKQASWGAK